MSSRDIQDEFTRAQEAFRAGNFAEAQGLLNLCLDKVPDDRDVRFLRGAALARMDKLTEGGEDFITLVAKDLQDIEALNNLAVIYGRQDKLQDALGTLLDTIDMEPTRIALYYNIGTIHKRLGNAKAAAMAYAKVAELDDGYVPAYNNLGIIQFSQGQYPKAEETFSRILENHPGDGAALNNLGVVLAGQGKTEEGIQKFRQALEANPPSAAAAANLERASMPPDQAQTAFLLDEPPEFLLIDPIDQSGAVETGEGAVEAPAEASPVTGLQDKDSGAGSLSISSTTALNLMRYLKAMTGGLPPKAKEMFLRSDARLSMEYIIAALEGHTGLFKEIQDRELAPASGGESPVSPGREIPDLTGTLDYLRKMAGSLGDPDLSEALRRKVDSVIFELEQPLPEDIADPLP
ncbi:MAG: tetratricopeptide repeat protein [Spirochaetaceae bacterium]|jgi:Flp pilus assembly protein TadD|nr:tetratricopeptide repeat protein [Spirochaetaceae bacterium]